jgi:hypothetical protein
MIDLRFNQNLCKIKNIFRGYCYLSSVNKQVIDNYGVSGDSINVPQNATNQVIRIGTNDIDCVLRMENLFAIFMEDCQLQLR